MKLARDRLETRGSVTQGLANAPYALLDQLAESPACGGGMARVVGVVQVVGMLERYAVALAAP